MNSPAFFEFLSEQEVIFWDWNGTLVNDLEHCLKITSGFFTLKGQPPLSKEVYLKAFDLPISKYHKNLKLKEKGLCEREVSAYFVDHYQKGRHELPLYSGAKDLLVKLSDEGVKQVLFSAARTSELDFQVKSHGLGKVFDVLSGACDRTEGQCKMQRGKDIAYRYKDAKGILVGDTLHDAEIGKAIGFNTVWVSEGHQCITKAQGHKDVDFIYDRSFQEGKLVENKL